MTSAAELNPDFVAYNETQEPADREICDMLLSEITRNMTGATSKIWHGSPVWFHRWQSGRRVSQAQGLHPGVVLERTVIR